MVDREIFGSASAGEDSPGVSRVSADDLSPCDKNDCACAARVDSKVIGFVTVNLLVDLAQLCLAILCLHQFIHLEKAFFECLFVSFLSEGLQFSQLGFEVIFNEKGNFLPTMAIEDTKQRHPRLLYVQVSYVGILH